MTKMTSTDFQNLRHQWREKGLTEGSLWLHYKGGVYVIDGFGVDTHHGGFLVIYHRVGGPEFKAVTERGQHFFRAPEEWLEIVNHVNGKTRFEKKED